MLKACLLGWSYFFACREAAIWSRKHFARSRRVLTDISFECSAFCHVAGNRTFLYKDNATLAYKTVLHNWNIAALLGSVFSTCKIATAPKKSNMQAEGRIPALFHAHCNVKKVTGVWATFWSWAQDSLLFTLGECKSSLLEHTCRFNCVLQPIVRVVGNPCCPALKAILI